jgi:hypothetical protein
LRAVGSSGTLVSMSEAAWDRELVMTGLVLVSDVVANTQRIVELLEDDDGEEAEED